jgi:hypothetical protein
MQVRHCYLPVTVSSLKSAGTGASQAIYHGCYLCVLPCFAGLDAQRVSSLIQGVPPQSIPRQYLARGVYFTLANSREKGEAPNGSVAEAVLHVCSPAPKTAPQVRMSWDDSSRTSSTPRHTETLLCLQWWQ